MYLQYLEYRFDSKIRGLSSLIFAISLLLQIPVVIYVPALAFNNGMYDNIINNILYYTLYIYTATMASGRNFNQNE